MQVAGLPCHVCRERVLLAQEGCGCSACGVAWHHGCSETPQLCPACGKDPKVAEKELTDARRRETWKLLDRGRAIYLWMLVLRITVAIGGIIVIQTEDRSIYRSLRGADPERVDAVFRALLRGQFAGLLVFTVLWIFARQGSRRFRYLLGLPALAGLILSAGICFFPDGFSNRIQTVRSEKERQIEGRYFVQRHPVYAGVETLTALYIIWTCLFSRALVQYEAALRVNRLQR